MPFFELLIDFLCIVLLVGTQSRTERIFQEWLKKIEDISLL